MFRSGLGKGAQGLVMAVVFLAAARAGAAPPQFLDRYQGCLITGSGRISVELEHAVTKEQRRFGLMERTELPANMGMLFFYPAKRPPKAGFWMYNTRIPLDIAWLDRNGVILALDTMTPCDAEKARDCPTWSPGIEHRHVLEMNAGFFGTHDVDVGDRLIANLNDNKPCLSAD